MGNFIYRHLIFPWKRKLPRPVFVIERLSLLLFAASCTFWLWDKGFLPHEIPRLLIEDIQKENSFIGRFQTIIASTIAFLAARYAYLFNLHNQKQRSFIACHLIRSPLSCCSGIVNHTRKYLEEDVITHSHLEWLSKEMRRYYNACIKVDVSSLSPNIAWHIINCKGSLEALISSLDTMSDYLNRNLDIKSNKEYALYYSQNFEYAYNHIVEYISTHIHDFPPYYFQPTPAQAIPTSFEPNK